MAVRHLVPRAVLVARQSALDSDETIVGAALAAYWRGAAEATAAPELLGITLSAEIGMDVSEADRIARRAVATWRLDPAVSLAGLRRISEALGARGELPRDFACETTLDQRFVAAETRDVAVVRPTTALRVFGG